MLFSSFHLLVYYGYWNILNDIYSSHYISIVYSGLDSYGEKCLASVYIMKVKRIAFNDR